MTGVYWFGLFEFRTISLQSKKARYEIRNKKGEKTLLGHIEWCLDWKQYVFSPGENTEWNRDGLEYINMFICRLMQDRLMEKE